MILILQNEMLLLMLFCKRVLKHREDIPRYNKTINNSFLVTVCSKILYQKLLIQKYFNALTNKAEGK